MVNVSQGVSSGNIVVVSVLTVRPTRLMCHRGCPVGISLLCLC